MSEKEFIWRMRLNIYHQADKKKKTITYLCKKYEVSRSWFYKWKKRRNRYGDEGLRPKIRAKPKMPNCVSKEIEEEILRFCFQYPTYGPERIEQELKLRGLSCGHTGIYNVLKRKGLNTAKARLEWVRRESGEVVTADEMKRDREKSKTNHVEANYPGQLVSQDTFYIGCIKGIGRIHHQVACDCFSSFAAAKVYTDKTAKSNCLSGQVFF